MKDEILTFDDLSELMTTNLPENLKPAERVKHASLLATFLISTNVKKPTHRLDALAWTALDLIADAVKSHEEAHQMAGVLARAITELIDMNPDEFHGPVN